MMVNLLTWGGSKMIVILLILGRSEIMVIFADFGQIDIIYDNLYITSRTVGYFLSMCDKSSITYA